MRVCELKALLRNLPDDALIGAVDHHGMICALSVQRIAANGFNQRGNTERSFNADDYMIIART